MNALVTIEAAPTAGPHREGHTVFSPGRQAEFLQHLQLFGPRNAQRPARLPCGARINGRAPVSLLSYII